VQRRLAEFADAKELFPVTSSATQLLEGIARDLVSDLVDICIAEVVGMPDLRVERARTDVEGLPYGALEYSQRAAAQGTISVNDHVLAVPLIARRGIIGTLLMARVDSADRAEVWDIDSAMNLANRVASALDYALLMDQPGGELAAKLTSPDTPEAGSRRLWRIMDHVSDIILILDATGAIVYANRGAWRGLRCRPEEMIGRSFLDLIRDEDVDSVRIALDQLQSCAEIEMQAHVVRQSDGSVRTLHATATNLLDEPLVCGILISARDTTDQEQVEKRIRLQTHLLDAVEHAVIATDVHGRIIIWNSCAEKLYGWPAADVLGLNIREILAPEGLEERRPEIMAALLAGLSWSGEFMVSRRDSARVPVRVKNSPILDSQGNLAAIVAVSFDVSQQRRAEEDRKRLAAIVTASDSAIISWALDGTLLSWNSGAERMLGYLADEILGSSVTTVVPPEYVPGVATIGTHLRDRQQVSHYSTKCVRKDGRSIDVSITCSPLDDMAGQVVATAGIIRELTARAESRRQLSDSEQRFWSLFDHHPDAIYTIDTRGCYTALNPAVKQWFGFDPDEIVGLPFGQRGTPPSEHEQALKVALSGKSVIYESATHDGFGRILPVQVSLAPIVVDHKVVGAFGITKDITARKRAEQLLQRHARQQAALADLGLWALRGSPIQELYSATADLIADLLDVEMTAILQVVPDQNELILTGGVGWPEDMVGHAQFPAHPDSLLGFMLKHMEPVRIDTVDGEERFSLELIAGRGMRSGLAVIVPGMTKPNGALLAFTRMNLRFPEEDLSFLQSIANVIGAAIDRAAAGAELRRREQEFVVLVEHAADNIVRIDRDLRFTYVNPSVERMMGIPAFRLVGQTYRDFASEKDADAWDLALHRVFRRGESEEIELTYPCTSGQRYFQVRLSPELGDDGAVKSVLGVGREITSLKLRELERAELYRELLDRNERLHAMVERALLNQGEVQAKRASRLSEVGEFTTRERQILTLLGRGLTNKQIARELNLTAGTVKNYVASLLGRLHATDRTHAAVLACKLDLVPSDDT
jgi:PAS domain S-box-containing protein